MQEDLKKVSPDNSGNIDREFMIDYICSVINPNKIITTVNTVIIEKSNNKKHLIRWFNQDGIRTVILTSMREMFLTRDQYNIPLYIWDIIDHIEEKWNSECSKYDWEWACDCYQDMVLNRIKILLNLWVKKRKTIDEQNIDCIKYIYNILSEK